MSNLTINRIGAEAQADSAWHDEDLEAGRFSALDVRPAPSRMRGRDALGVALAGLVALAGWLALLLTFWAAARLTEWEGQSSAGWVAFWHALLSLTAILPLALVGIGVAMWLVERWNYVRRASVVRDKLMNPLPAHVIDRLTVSEYLAILDRMAALEREVAPYRAYRGVESLSLSAGQSRPAGSEPPALVASVPVDLPAQWLAEALASEAHLLLAGKTNCGKTTTAEALLATAVNRGDAVLVIDPHWQPGKWHGVAAVGAGRDYRAIRAMLRALEGEMTARYTALAAGEPLGPQALVIIDEVPAILGELGDDWKRFGKRLGSEARKIGIRLVLISQSPLVEDVGCNSAMRRNFTIIGLDLASIKLMLREEPDPAIRRAILDRLEGERYPALYERLGQFRILDRAGLDRIRPSRAPLVWRPVLSAGQSLDATERTDERTDADDLTRLKALIRAGLTRDEARARGYEFANDDWSRARKAVEEEVAVLNGLLVASHQDGLQGNTEVPA